MSHSLSARLAAWHLLRTKPRQEFRALENLENQGYGCFLPTLETEKVSGGARKLCIEPLFSRYLFIRLDPVTSNWAPIRSTRGVSEIVRFGDRSAVLPDECVEAMRNAPLVRLRRLFARGDRIVVDAGPFAGIEGFYQEPDGEERAMVLIDMLNQPQKLSFAIETLRKAD